jgi:uncharacterized membrane protein (UPF0127 family)
MKSRQIPIILSAAAIIAGLCFFFTGNGRQTDYYVVINDITIPVEIAADPVSRSTGLMFRESLPENEGMLFIFPETKTANFWMKNTYFPLDIAFINEQMTIIKLDSMKSHDETRHSSDNPVKYVLETNIGFFSRWAIREGDTVLLPECILGIEPE